MSKIIEFDINENIENENKISEIEELCRNNSKLSIPEIEALLGNLSYLVREKISNYENKDIKDYMFYNKCDLAQSMIYYYLDKLNINAHPVNTNDVIQGVCGHSIVIASFDTPDGEKLYLVDPTYMQFFDSEKCNVNNYVIINDTVCVSPDPGYFVKKDDNEEAVLPLLKNGYIELTEEFARVYGDSFFKTKQGTPSSQIDNNHASGANYIKWFLNCTSTLSKTEKELEDMQLLISPLNNNKSLI